MHLLLVAATRPEITPFIRKLEQTWSRSPDGKWFKGNCTISILITGIGMHRTAYALAKSFATEKPDLCINAGIAGAFAGKAEIGEVVHVTEERIIDFGAEDPSGGLIEVSDIPLEEDISSSTGLKNTQSAGYAFLRNVRGVTSHLAHGSAGSVLAVREKYDPDIETMESAAFFYCCLKEEVPFLAVRSISNIVAPRNKEDWNITLAVERLCTELVEIAEFFAGV